MKREVTAMSHDTASISTADSPSPARRLWTLLSGENEADAEIQPTSAGVVLRVRYNHAVMLEFRNASAEVTMREARALRRRFESLGWLRSNVG
jgi:hypothetical protein